MAIKKWRWMDKQGSWWVANQPESWMKKMRKAGYKVLPFQWWEDWK